MTATFDPLDTTSATNLDGPRRAARSTIPSTAAPAARGSSPGTTTSLAATKDVETFQASFREPGVVVPDEEQFINEIAEPRHGHVRRIINSAIAQHRIGRVEPVARELCDRLLDDLLAAGPGRTVASISSPATPPRSPPP